MIVWVGVVFDSDFWGERFSFDRHISSLDGDIVGRNHDGFAFAIGFNPSFLSIPVFYLADESLSIESGFHIGCARVVYLVDNVLRFSIYNY